MTTRTARTLPLLLSIAMAAGPLCAQESEDPLARLEATIRGAFRQPAEAPGLATLDTEIERLVAPTTELTADQYRRAGVMLVRAGRPVRAGRIAARGLERHRDDPALCELLGVAEFARCQGAGTDAAMRGHAHTAMLAFARARKAGATTPSAHLLAWQAALIDCSFDQALAAFEMASGDERFAEQLPDRHLARGMILLGAGRYAEALAELEHEELDAAMRANTEAMAVRALAMTGETEAAVKRARRLWEKAPDAMWLGFHADALGADGRFDEALQLLQQHPVRRLDGESDTRLEQRRQSRRALEWLLALRGGKPTDPTRDLARVLGHSVTVAAAGSEDEDLSASPLLLGYTVRQAPSSPKGWANDLLSFCCVVAAADYEPGATEKKLLPAVLDDASRAALLGDAARPRALEILRATALREDFEGTLMALRLAAQL